MSLVERVKAWPMPASDVWVRYLEHGPDGAFSAAALRAAREAVAAEADREMAQRDATIERLCEALGDLIERSRHCGEMYYCGPDELSPWEAARAALSEARKT